MLRPLPAQGSCVLPFTFVAMPSYIIVGQFACALVLPCEATAGVLQLNLVLLLRGP